MSTMAKYEFPVKFHRFSTEEFNKKKAEYNAKYGYTMHVPGFSDIVKIGRIPPPDDDELAKWKAKDYEALGEIRTYQIGKLMKAKKESFLRMMSSPTPTWINNIGTSMNFLDDVNDSLGTLSVIARLGAHMLPKAVGKLLLGPAGWALMAADIAQIAMTVMRAPLTRVMRKSALSKATATNPFCKEAKVERAKRLKRLKPTKGEAIEALQVTNGVFGVGLCLGPIVGAFIEAFTGPFRVLQGKSVKVKWPMPKLAEYEFRAMEGLEACQQLITGDQELSDEDYVKTYMVANMATQVLHPIFEEWHPLENIDGIENIILTPPPVRDPGTKLILEEAGINWRESQSFLHAETIDAPVGHLMDIGFDLNTNSFLASTQDLKHTYEGLIGSQSVNDFAQNSLALLEDESEVQLDFHPVEKAFFTIMESGFIFAPDTTDAQVKAFADRVMAWDSRGFFLPFKTLRKYAESNLKIKFVVSQD